MTQIIVNKDLYLSEPVPGDAPFFVKHLNHIGHYNNTLRVPFPYEEKHAYEYINFAMELKSKFERPMCWQVRTSANEMIGGIGLLGVYGKDSHKDELGYWVANTYWGKGIATAVVRVFCSYVFEHYNLSRIEAHVFTHNKASMRVLEKCGFSKESLKQKCFLKGERFIDAVSFALVR